MFDVFYTGTKPGLFPHEREAKNIEHAQTLCSTRYFWWITYLCDYSQWDWLWEPPPWQSHQRHAWPSQFQKDSGTYLVPCGGYSETNYHSDPMIKRQRSDEKNWIIPAGVDVDSFDWAWHPDATDPPYIYQFGTQHQRTGGPRYCVPGAVDVKFVNQLKIKTDRVATAIVEIDHLDGNAGKIPGCCDKVRYFDNYKDTLTRIARRLEGEHEFVWICSSICDYSNFDFSWHPEHWQAGMLHVFASDGEKFGDTFFMHVPTFAYRVERVELLEWYDVNFVNVSVPRRPMPVIVHNNDSQVDAIKTNDFLGPLALFTNHDYVTTSLATVPLWRKETKAIVPLSNGAGSVIVPKVAVPFIKTQLYDYAHIDKTQRMLKDDPLDIVFISNGEPNAVKNDMKLLQSCQAFPNRVHYVENVNGRVAAYHAAAQQSTTPWFFAVFAKLSVAEHFDWWWQPDRMQQPKHYIFHARNPVNDLVYGHQAMIAYNKKLVLENPGNGLDFTLDQAHEVVPILSGTAEYHISDWMCWRTAFREALKLRASLPDVENEYRLNCWLTKDSTPGQWSMKGAQDAMEFYDQVNGDAVELKKSYEWNWLASYAFMRRNLTVND
jgi:hypothetical protein